MRKYLLLKGFSVPVVKEFSELAGLHRETARLYYHNDRETFDALVDMALRKKGQ